MQCSCLCALPAACTAYEHRTSSRQLLSTHSSCRKNETIKVNFGGHNLSHFVKSVYNSCHAYSVAPRLLSAACKRSCVIRMDLPANTCIATPQARHMDQATCQSCLLLVAHAVSSVGHGTKSVAFTVMVSPVGW